MVLGAMIVLAACIIVLLKGLWVLRMYRLFRGAKVMITTIIFGMIIVVLVRCPRAAAAEGLALCLRLHLARMGGRTGLAAGAHTAGTSTRATCSCSSCRSTS
jgi:hypothetical protein